MPIRPSHRIGFGRFLRHSRDFVVGPSSMIFWPSILLAQDAGGGGAEISSSRSWVFEAVIVAVMFGLALFAVCRSSRRN